jgi:hypothetical protein
LVEEDAEGEFNAAEEDGNEEDAGQEEGNKEEEIATAGGDVDTEGNADI